MKDGKCPESKDNKAADGKLDIAGHVKQAWRPIDLPHKYASGNSWALSLFLFLTSFRACTGICLSVLMARSYTDCARWMVKAKATNLSLPVWWT